MARQSRRSKGGTTGRVTPKGGRPDAGGPGRGRRPRPGVDEPVQVGRRPSNPFFLLVVGIMWMLCGAAALIWLKASWKIVPGVVFIGIGLMFARGAAATVTRREHRESGG